MNLTFYATYRQKLIFIRTITGGERLLWVSLVVVLLNAKERYNLYNNKTQYLPKGTHRKT